MFLHTHTYNHLRMMCFFLVLTVIGKIILIFWLVILIFLLTIMFSRTVEKLVGPSSFYFDTTMCPVNRSLKIKRYLGILKKNLNKTVETLCDVDHINTIKKNSLIPTIESFVKDTEMRLNKQIDDAYTRMLWINIDQDIIRGNNTICTEINRIFNQNRCDLRLMCVANNRWIDYRGADNYDAIFKVYIVEKYYVTGEKFPIFKFTDTDETNVGNDKSFFLVNYEQGIHDFMSRYVTIEKIQTSIVTGEMLTYSQILYSEFNNFYRCNRALIINMCLVYKMIHAETKTEN